MEIFDIHFKNIDKKTIQLTLDPHITDKREREEDVIGVIMGEGFINAKFRFMEWVEKQFG